MAKAIWSLASGLLMVMAAQAAAAPTVKMDQVTINHGRKLVNIGGCNDCHTPGWSEHGGRAPKDRLLVGGAFGFQGPWGTTYPINLRLFVRPLTVKQWIQTVRTTKARPLMPYWVFRDMSDNDLASIYYYIRSLGPAGKPAHPWIPPGKAAAPPYMKLVAPPSPHGAAGGH